MTQRNRGMLKLQKQKELLKWILSEWDCRDLEQAKKEALEDSALHLKLREAGITFD